MAHPGEISFASHGVLFLDELPEFNREMLKALLGAFGGELSHCGPGIRLIYLSGQFHLRGQHESVSVQIAI